MGTNGATCSQKNRQDWSPDCHSKVSPSSGLKGLLSRVRVALYPEAMKAAISTTRSAGLVAAKASSSRWRYSRSSATLCCPAILVQTELVSLVSLFNLFQMSPPHSPPRVPARSTHTCTLSYVWYIATSSFSIIYHMEAKPGGGGAMTCRAGVLPPPGVQMVTCRADSGSLMVAGSVMRVRSLPMALFKTDQMLKPLCRGAGWGSCSL